MLNVTPDSFSDGGDHDSLAAAVAFGQRLAAEGADLVDVGGESTRPGAGRVEAAQELDRVVPVVAGLTAAGVSCSVDTMRSEVAVAAVAAGAVLVNDVSGGLADEQMLTTVARLGVPFIAMHWRGHSAGMQARAGYDDVVGEVCDELAERLDACASAGVREVVLDPGLGFAKNSRHNWSLLQALPRLVALGPVLVGASRKAFLGELLDGRDVRGRDTATAAVSLLAAQAGVWGVRVHDVAGTSDALRVLTRLTATP